MKGVRHGFSKRKVSLTLNQHKEVLNNGHDATSRERAAARKDVQTDRSDYKRGRKVVEQCADAVEQLGEGSERKLALRTVETSEGTDSLRKPQLP